MSLKRSSAPRPQSAGVRHARLTGIACLCLIAASSAALATTPEQATTPSHGRPAPTPAAGDDVRAAAAAARAFVEDYLRWTAGRQAPSRIANGSRELRQRLVAVRLRPSRGTRRGRPQITELRTDLTSPVAGSASARIIDRALQTQYTVKLTLTRGENGWEVGDVRS